MHDCVDQRLDENDDADDLVDVNVLIEREDKSEAEFSKLCDHVSEDEKEDQAGVEVEDATVSSGHDVEPVGVGSVQVHNSSQGVRRNPKYGNVQQEVQGKEEQQPFLVLEIHSSAKFRHAVRGLPEPALAVLLLFWNHPLGQSNCQILQKSFVLVQSSSELLKVDSASVNVIPQSVVVQGKSESLDVNFW